MASSRPRCLSSSAIVAGVDDTLSAVGRAGSIMGIQRAVTAVYRAALFIDVLGVCELCVKQTDSALQVEEVLQVNCDCRQRTVDAAGNCHGPQNACHFEIPDCLISPSNSMRRRGQESSLRAHRADLPTFLSQKGDAASQNTSERGQTPGIFRIEVADQGGNRRNAHTSLMTCCKTPRTMMTAGLSTTPVTVGMF